jgi:para-nitrobenzyl esterase
MISHWTQFAKNGDPNSSDQPLGAPCQPATDLRQSLVPPTPQVEMGYAADHRCAFWDRF